MTHAENQWVLTLENADTAVLLAHRKMVGLRAMYRAAVQLLEKGKTSVEGVNYDDPFMLKVNDLRYQWNKIDDAKGKERVRSRNKAVVEEIKATIAAIDNQLNAHKMRQDKFAVKKQMVISGVEYLALKNGLYDHEDYDPGGRTIGQCIKEASDVISKHIGDSGEFEE